MKKRKGEIAETKKSEVYLIMQVYVCLCVTSVFVCCCSVLLLCVRVCVERKGGNTKNELKMRVCVSYSQSLMRESVCKSVCGLYVRWIQCHLRKQIFCGHSIKKNN